MKKLLTLALAVFGFATAQAITINWTGTHNLANPITFKDGWDYTLTLTITSATAGTTTQSLIAGVPEGNPSLFQFIGANDADLLAIDVVRDNPSWEAHAGPNPNWKNIDCLPSGELPKITFVVTGTGTSAGVLGNVKINYLEGQDGSGGAGSGFHSMGDITTIEGLKVLDGTQGSLTVQVPEPTVLALLALGVAGIALKRKKVVA